MNSKLNGNRLHDLEGFGQSVWIDDLRREMLQGPLTRLVTEDGVSGVTSNPTIFAKAYAEDPSYRSAIETLRKRGANGQQMYEQLSSDDVRMAADQLRKVYEQSGRQDGYVSIEVPPKLAHDAGATVEAARELFHRIDRPNVMIKIPSTEAGVEALRELIAAGVNVNATLVFGTKRYQQLADAYMEGLERRVAAGRPLDHVASVVSLFVSRIDTLVDKTLDSIQHAAKAVRAQHARGKAAIAVARFAYQEYREMIASPRWRALAARHAQPQRLLWASTSTKDPSYSDVKYVNELVGKETVNTMPLGTLNAFRDHGSAAPSLESNLFEVASLPGELQGLGIDLDAVSQQLENEGIAAFAKSMDQLVTQLASS